MQLAQFRNAGRVIVGTVHPVVGLGQPLAVTNHQHRTMLVEQPRRVLGNGVIFRFRKRLKAVTWRVTKVCTNC